jgi:ABC-2 type transport system ATP-binding protein
MGAGAYVGRIGGLAVALGIGAAVFVGQGAASAEPSSTSGAESSASSGTSAAQSKQPADGKTTASTDSSETKAAVTDPAPKKKKKSSGSQPSSKITRVTLGSTGKTGTVTAQTVQSDATESAKVAEDPAPTASVSVVRAASAVSAGVQQRAQPTVSAPQAPVAVVTAISRVVSAVLKSFAGSGQTGVPESPLGWMLMAVTRLESFGRTPTLSKAVNAVTTSADAAPVAPEVSPAVSPPVVAIPQTPPLAALQQLPIIGANFVTPVVSFIAGIPLIGDVLHPLIGYAVQPGLPPGTPVPRDVKVISFDGTPIYVHFMPAVGLKAGQQAPTILDGPGLALPGATDPDAEKDEFLPNETIGILPLREDGYNVVTWDPRGEWNSGGELQIDSPDFEAKDVSAIISWLATQPEVDLNGPGDPEIGMVGASYGGGIQLVAAATDPRIDAIVPTIAWNSLNTALYKNDAFKSSWGTLLSAALLLTGARANPAILPAAIIGDLTGQIPPADQQLLADRGPGDLVSDITAPTMLVQGTVDTLFTLAEADANAKVLIADGVPTKVEWFCGGHGACLTSTNDGVLIQQNTLAWLDRYVKGNTLVPTGPQFEWVDQNGAEFSSTVYPVPQGTPIVASSVKSAVLPLLPFIGGSGPQLKVTSLGPIGALLGIPSGSKAVNAINLTIPAATTTTYIVGAPQLSLTYSGTGASTHVYAQLVDDTTGLVLGNLVTPVPVTLDGQTHTVSVPMEMVAQTLSPGQTVTLQLVASAFPYETITSAGVLDVSSLNLSLPTANAASVTQLSAV